MIALRAFVRRRGLVQRRFRPVERDMLAGLLAELVARIEAADLDGADPVLDRLLPVTYRDDPLAELEYRTAVRSHAASGRASVLLRMRDDLARADGGPVRLDGPAADAWLRGLGDLRIAWTVRYGDAAMTGTGRPAAVYAWLSWLQSGLVDAVTAG